MDGNQNTTNRKKVRKFSRRNFLKFLGTVAVVGAGGYAAFNHLLPMVLGNAATREIKNSTKELLTNGQERYVRQLVTADIIPHRGTHNKRASAIPGGQHEEFILEQSRGRLFLFLALCTGHVFGGSSFTFDKCGYLN